MRDRKAFRSFVGCANINWFIKIVNIHNKVGERDEGLACT